MIRGRILSPIVHETGICLSLLRFSVSSLSSTQVLHTQFTIISRQYIPKGLPQKVALFNCISGTSEHWVTSGYLSVLRFLFATFLTCQTTCNWMPPCYLHHPWVENTLVVDHRNLTRMGLMWSRIAALTKFPLPLVTSSSPVGSQLRSLDVY